MQLRQFIDAIFMKKEIDITPDIEPDSADLIVPMAAHNFGLGFVPQGIAENAIEKGEVFRVNLEEELPPRYVCLVMSPNHPQTSASRELARMITRANQKQ